MLTKEEAEVAPHLVQVRLLVEQGKPSEGTQSENIAPAYDLALELLMNVVRKTQGDQGVNKIMEEGKQQYNQLIDVSLRRINSC